MTDSIDLRKCPECGKVMAHHLLDDLHLDLCEACGGVWYDAGQFTRLLKDGVAEVDAAEKLEPPEVKPLDVPARMGCPVDGTPLHHGLFKGHAGVELASCYQCAGLFLSAASLKQLDALEDAPGGLADAPVLTPEEVADMGQLDAQAARDVYKAQLQCYAWGRIDPFAAKRAMRMFQ